MSPPGDRDVFLGLRRRGTGSATSGPPGGGYFVDACSGFARAADRSVAPSRFDARISPDAGDFTTRDPGVSLDRTFTDWLSSACRLVIVMANLLPRHPICWAHSAEKPSAQGKLLFSRQQRPSDRRALPK